MTKERLLEKVNNVLKEEQVNFSNIPNDEKLNSYIIPSLEQSKNTLSNLYKYEPIGKGVFRKLKVMIFSKLKNIVINIVEKESTRQQKFNELAFQAICLIAEENKELKKKLAEK